MPNPSVSVEIAEYRPISVLGEVNRPGQYPYQPGLTMLGAVALAGGFTYRAVTSYGTDIRPDGSGGNTIKGRIAGDTHLEPGDVGHHSRALLLRPAVSAGRARLRVVSGGRLTSGISRPRTAFVVPYRNHRSAAVLIVNMFAPMQSDVAI